MVWMVETYCVSVGFSSSVLWYRVLRRTWTMVYVCLLSRCSFSRLSCPCANICKRATNGMNRHKVST
eukprot:m.3252 g.3252  ORF g.3252 m.3252 type:complete len:67 (+) comp2653_c0_seq1:228-428(+)